jgi:hypothetical protein
MNNPEDNQAQAQSDAPPDAVAEGRQEAERADGRGSDANGIPEGDDAAGEERKRLYKETGSPIVSRMD